MKSYRKMRAAISVLLISQYFLAFGQDTLPPYLITSDTALEYKFTTAYYQILPDKTGKLTIDEVKNGVNSKQFFTKDKTPAGLDTMVNTTWYRYNVKNNLEKEISISLVARSLQSAFFVIRNNTQQTHYKSGFNMPWNKKDGLPTDNIIPIKLQAGEQVTIYNRVENDRPGTRYGFQVKLYNTEKYSLKRLSEMQEFIAPELVIVMVFFGFSLLAGIFNFLLFLIDKQKVHLHFSMFLLALALFNSPVYYMYIARYVPYLSKLFDFVTISFFLMFFIQFIRYYFQSFINTPRFDKFLVSLIFLLLIPSLELFNLLPESVGIIIRYVTFLLSCFASVVIFYRLKHPKVKPFTWALLPFGFAVLGNVVMFAFQNEGYSFSTTSNFLAGIALFLGVGWSVVYFTWILFKQYNTQKRQIIQQAFDAERIAKEKEIERNTLIEQQKIELEKTVLERTDELRQSIADLQSTQKQLIQSEKMASLGELTAGIAHEIQNPLNFVNNFSEVNTELIDELEQEINKGNLEEVKLLAKDIKENEQKINHHGKRAGDIVKGMLQHSRSSIGVKEPTNINALADEYLRLAYHGLRAKDKEFNATMKTDFDETLGNINIIPQDIGRVILNLITNAFYVVNEKAKAESRKQNAEEKSYEPTVSITTKHSPLPGRGAGGEVLISVKDNGNGIPQKIVDKIFQPFFTTKPTGQGIGLGLSLSYDIVKAHGGELKVETKEGEGSEFIIQIPVV